MTPTSIQKESTNISKTPDDSYNKTSIQNSHKTHHNTSNFLASLIKKSKKKVKSPRKKLKLLKPEPVICSIQEMPGNQIDTTNQLELRNHIRSPSPNNKTKLNETFNSIMTIPSCEFDQIDINDQDQNGFIFELDLTNRTIQLPLVKCGNNRFMLHTKNNHVQLSKFIRKWLRDNEYITEDKYKQYIDDIVLKNKPISNIAGPVNNFPDKEQANNGYSKLDRAKNLRNSLYKEVTPKPKLNKLTQTDVDYFDILEKKEQDKSVIGLLKEGKKIKQRLSQILPMTSDVKRDSFFDEIEKRIRVISDHDLDDLVADESNNTYKKMKSIPGRDDLSHLTEVDLVNSQNKTLQDSNNR